MQPTQKLLSHHSSHYGASTGGEPANRSQQPEEQSGIQLGKGRDVLRKGSERIRSAYIDTLSIDLRDGYLERVYVVCRNLIGDMLDSYPCYTFFSLPLPSCPSTLGTTLRRPFIFPTLIQQRTMQSNTLPLSPQYNKYNTQSKSTDSVKDGTMQTIEAY